MVYEEDLLGLSFMQVENLILGGYLNFSLAHVEYLGHNAQVDSLMDLFEKILENNRLIDIEFAQTQPTWRNHKTGSAMLARRLDWFLIKESLMDNINSIR